MKLAKLVLLGALALTSSSGLALGPNYSYEFVPFYGINLPSDLWGTPGTLNVFGLRAGLRLFSSSAIEAGAFMHKAAEDSAYTFDGAYRYETYGSAINGYFVLGMHYSKFTLKLDRDAAGRCVPANCQTDSGTHTGFSIGGGFLLPVTDNNPLRFGLRYYKNPQTWVLVEVGFGFRN